MARITIQGSIINRRVWIAQEVVDEEHQRPGRIISFYRDPDQPKGENPGDGFLVEWADGTETMHRRDEFEVPA